MSQLLSHTVSQASMEQIYTFTVICKKFANNFKKLFFFLKPGRDGHSSALMQHGATLGHFLTYNLSILPSVSVSWLQ